MTVVNVDQLVFTFQTGATVSKYDESSFYRNQYQSVCGKSKAVDILCVNGTTTWLIEVKDYRSNRRTKPQDLGDEIAEKVRDTLAGLVATSVNSNDQAEKTFAQQALASTKLKVVCHLEQPRNPSKLFPQVIKDADLSQKLRQRLKAIDSHPRVAAVANMHGSLCWTVT